MKKQYKAVFISPHLDDAVWSCGGTIAKLVSEDNVLVLNIFTAFSEDIKKGPIVIDKNRYQEEADATAYLGFTSDKLNEPDAIFRRKVYQSPARLFDHIDTEDLIYIPQLSEKIKHYLSSIDYNSLYVPLGIGWHIDHILCYLAMENFFTQPNLFFYEDSPYCLIPNATLYRLNELGLISPTKNDASLKQRFFLCEWYETTRHYARMAPMKNLRPLPYQLLANVVMSIYLFKLMIRHRFSQKEEKNVNFKPYLNNITKYFKLKIDAISLYESQFKEFFINRTDCESLYKNYSYRISGANELYERFWQIY
jgi:LmbE family N-acetylglucosaminyl deacetylase